MEAEADKSVLPSTQLLLKIYKMSALAGWS